MRCGSRDAACNNKDLRSATSPPSRLLHSTGTLRGALITEIIAEDRPKPEIKVQGYFACSGGGAACRARRTLHPVSSLWRPYRSLRGPSCSLGCCNPILAKLSTASSSTSVPPATSATALGLKPASNSLHSIGRQQRLPRLTSCLKTNPTTAATRTMRKMRDRSMAYCGQKGRDGTGWMEWGRMGWMG